MSLTVTAESGFTKDLVPEGRYLSRCVRIVDLGELKNSYNKYTPKILFQWEVYVLDREGKLMGVTINNDWQPYLASRRFTPSLKKDSPLRLFLEKWRGRLFTDEELAGFNLGKCLGVYAFITIKHSPDKKYADVESAELAGKEVSKPSPILPLLILDFDDPNLAVFLSLSDHLKETIKNSRNCPEVFRNPAMAVAAQPATNAEETF